MCSTYKGKFLLSVSSIELYVRFWRVILKLKYGKFPKNDKRFKTRIFPQAISKTMLYTVNVIFFCTREAVLVYSALFRLNYYYQNWQGTFREKSKTSKKMFKNHRLEIFLLTIELAADSIKKHSNTVYQSISYLIYELARNFCEKSKLLQSIAFPWAITLFLANYRADTLKPDNFLQLFVSQVWQVSFWE